MDTADYILQARRSSRPRAPQGKSDFPAQVAFVPALPMVPLNDDTPKNYKPPTDRGRRTRPTTGARDAEAAATPPADDDVGAHHRRRGRRRAARRSRSAAAPSSGAKAGHGGQDQRRRERRRSRSATCNERACTATVSATPDQINQRRQRGLDSVSACTRGPDRT